MSTGTVKFFNAAKGFGFITPDDGGADIFVHISAVERSGLSGLNDGDQVDFEAERDQRSGKLAAIDLRVTGAAPAASRPPRQSAGFERGPANFSSRPASGPSGSGSGVVKWFNGQKGFGFIQPDDGAGDIFVHISAVERSGLNDLREGQRVSFDLEQDRRSGKTTAANLRVTG